MLWKSIVSCCKPHAWVLTVQYVLHLYICVRLGNILGLANTWFIQHLAHPTPGLSSICMFRCLLHRAPAYLSQLFFSTSTSAHHKTRSSSTSQLNLPSVKSSFGQKALSFTGTSLAYSTTSLLRTTKDFGISQTFANTSSLSHDPLYCEPQFLHVEWHSQ